MIRLNSTLYTNYRATYKYYIIVHHSHHPPFGWGRRAPGSTIGECMKIHSVGTATTLSPIVRWHQPPFVCSTQFEPMYSSVWSANAGNAGWVGLLALTGTKLGNRDPPFVLKSAVTGHFAKAEWISGHLSQCLGNGTWTAHHWRYSWNKYVLVGPKCGQFSVKSTHAGKDRPKTQRAR